MGGGGGGEGGSPVRVEREGWFEAIFVVAHL